MDRVSPIVGIAAVLLAVGTATVTNAETPQAPRVRDACLADVRALCATVSPGGGRLLQCLKDHGDRISAACRTALQAAAEKRKGASR